MDFAPQKDIALGGSFTNRVTTSSFSLLFDGSISLVSYFFMEEVIGSKG